VSKFTKQINETGKLKLFEGSDKFFRDFVCVNDLVKIVLNNNKPSGIYDLGSNHSYSFQRYCRNNRKKIRGGDHRDPLPRTSKKQISI